MKPFKFFLGLLLGFTIILFPLTQFQATPLETLQTLAVQLDGRKKPFDTVALETVAKIHGSATYQQTDGPTLDGLQTYLALMFNDRDWNQQPFILLSYLPLKTLAGFDPKQTYFSFEDLINSAELGEIVRQAHRNQAQDLDLSRDEREALVIEDRLTLMLQTVGAQNLPIVPHPTDPKGTWVSLPHAQDLYEPEQVAAIVAHWNLLAQAYTSSLIHPDQGLGALGNIRTIATQLHQELANLSPSIYPQDTVLKREVHYNHFHPFGKAWILYTIAFCVMLLAFWLKPWDLYWSAIGLFTAGIGVQIYGFALRVLVADRPPVTNMYESVIWVGFGIAALALWFELTSRARYYLLAAAPLATFCLVLADRLPAVLDPSIGPLVPVLRDNFWLSVHVPTITLSYASFALAMGMGHVALVHYWFAAEGSDRLQNLSLWNYRVLQAGVLLLTTGIILGGIWAHFSWGRFWGWDPKETWALIALLCYLLPLHGRLVGWIGPFGLNVASIVSFNAILMAWYGVNFILGTGLHSYGFSTGSSELMIGSIVAMDLLFVLVTIVRYQTKWPLNFARDL